MLPIKQLKPRLRSPNNEHIANTVGMELESEFLLRLSFTRAVKDPIISGTTPVKELEESTRERNAVKVIHELGIEPCNLFFDNVRDVR